MERAEEEHPLSKLASHTSSTGTLGSRAHQEVEAALPEDEPRPVPLNGELDGGYACLEAHNVQEGRYGWICALCAGAFLFSTLGANSSWRTFVAYSLETKQFSWGTEINFALIRGACLMTALVISPVPLILVKVLEAKWMITVGIVIHILLYIFVSFSTEFWQFLVLRGFMLGLSYGFIITSASSIIPEWFVKENGLASGAMSMGAGVVSPCFSLMVDALLTSIGERWCLRCLGIITTAIMAISVGLITKKRKNRQERVFSIEALKIAALQMFDKKELVKWQLWVASFRVGVSLLGYGMFLVIFTSSATSHKIDLTEKSFLMISLNFSRLAGKQILAHFPNHWVPLPYQGMILNSFLAALSFGLTRARVGRLDTFKSLLPYGMVYGSSLGWGKVAHRIVTADVYKPEKLGCEWAMSNVAIGILTMFSEVIVISMTDDSLETPFLKASMVAGCSFVAGALTLIPLRHQ